MRIYVVLASISLILAGCAGSPGGNENSSDWDGIPVAARASADLGDGLSVRAWLEDDEAIVGEEADEREDAVLRYLRGSNGDLVVHFENNGREFLDAIAVEYDVDCIIEGISQDRLELATVSVRAKDSVYLANTLSPGQEIEKTIVACEPPRSTLGSQFRGEFSDRAVVAINGTVTLLSSNHAPIAMDFKIERFDMLHYTFVGELPRSEFGGRICMAESDDGSCLLDLSSGIQLRKQPISGIASPAFTWTSTGSGLEPLVVPDVVWEIEPLGPRLSKVDIVAPSNTLIDEACIEVENQFDLVVLCGLPGTNYMVEGARSWDRTEIYDCFGFDIESGHITISPVEYGAYSWSSPTVFENHTLDGSDSLCFEDLEPKREYAYYRFSTSDDFRGNFWIDRDD